MHACRLPASHASSPFLIFLKVHFNFSLRQMKVNLQAWIYVQVRSMLWYFQLTCRLTFEKDNIFN